MSYESVNHSRYENLNITICYLCGKALKGAVNKDHIIPTTMFTRGSEHRPQLPVHKACNGGKSLVDERFKFRVLLMSSTNQVAGEMLKNELLIPANLQKENAGIVGKSNDIRDYKLARTIAKDLQHQLSLKVNGQELVQIRSNDEHVAELDGYASKMTRGLFMRNVPDSNPRRPRLQWIDKKRMSINGGDQLKKTMEPIKDMINNASAAGTLFSQVWSDIGYVGTRLSDSKNTGFVWVEFYNTFGVIAWFPPPKVKKDIA